MKIFSIFDKKSEGYKPPFACPTIGQAERSFLDACNEEGTDLHKHPEDYQLWMVGTFDIYSGEIGTERTHVANGAYTTDLRRVAQDG